MTRSDQPKPPAVAIVRQNGLSSASSRAAVARCYTRVMADLVDPGGRWSAAGTSPLLRRPLTVSRLGADSEDEVCRYITSKSGDMTKEAQSSFTDDVWDVEQTGTVQNFIVGHKIVLADVQDAPLAAYMEGIQPFPIGLYEGPGLGAIE